MRIPRLYWYEPLSSQTEVTLSIQQSFHLHKVLRKKTGETIQLFDGQGKIATATIKQLHNNASLQITSIEEDGYQTTLKITLATGLCRGNKMDFLLQKAIELGITEIILLQLEKSPLPQKYQVSKARLAHWQKTIIAAAEQSGNMRIPQVQQPISIDTLLQEKKMEKSIACDPRAHKTLQQLSPPLDGMITIITGTESGFSEHELNQLITSGVETVTLGPRILRAESAPLVALSCCQLLWGDL